MLLKPTLFLDTSPSARQRFELRQAARHLCGSAAVLLFLASIVHAAAAVYEVGPGQPSATPSEVPWESLQAGDEVRIHWRSAPYQDKWVIARQGTADQPIVVRGIPGPDGELPLIDGDGAQTRQALDYWSEGRGVIKVGGASVPDGATASYVVIEGLDVRGARPPGTYRDDAGTLQSYPNNAAAIYVEAGDHITVRRCILRDCGNGLFVAAASSEVLVDSNFIHDNGNVGSIYEHNSYTAAAGITFQFNRYGPLFPGAGGNNLKDRSAGTVIRFNWIEAGNRQLDLVDAEDSVALQQDPRYRTTFVYGNVLVEPDGAGNSQIVHYGGDSGNPAIYRQGTLHLFDNTVLSTRTGNTTLLRLSTNAERADCRNNIVLVTASGNRLAWLADAGSLSITHNWVKTTPVVSHAGTSFTGTLIDDGSTISGNDPGFLNAARQNLHLRPDSPCRSAGTSLHPAAVGHAPAWQYAKHQTGRPRRAQGLDLGAFAFSAYEAWCGDNFDDQAETPAVSGENADPDGDTIPNLIEYAFGLDPKTASLAGLPRPVLLRLPDGVFFAVEFRRRAAPSELVYQARASADLRTWSPGCEYSDAGGGLPIGETLDASDNGWTRVRLNRAVSDASASFLGVDVRRE